MKIFGIGTDIINIKRINNSIKKGGHNFKKKIFSDREINYCERKKNPGAFYAKRFAAKEAVSKALGLGMALPLSAYSVVSDTRHFSIEVPSNSARILVEMACWCVCGRRSLVLSIAIITALKKANVLERDTGRLFLPSNRLLIHYLALYCASRGGHKCLSNFMFLKMKL